MSNKKKKQSSTMENHHGSLRYLNGEGKVDIFDKIDYEVSSILLELSHFVEFSSDPPLLPKWGRTRKRSSSVSFNLPEISPVTKSPPCTEVGEMGSTSSSSCLTGEAKKTNPQTIKKSIEAEKNQWSKTQKNSSQPKSVFESEMVLIGAQVGLLGQPISEREDQNLQPLICVDRTVNVTGTETASLLWQARDNMERRSFDLNFPAPEEVGGCNNGIATFVGFQRVVNKVQAAQARQRRLGLIRSKKFYNNRFISPYQ